jgi:hypothetical protein
MNRLAGLTLAIAITAAGPAAAGVFISATNSGTTDLGLFAAGDWRITASGLADFTGNVGQLQFNPDGTLAQAPQAPFQSYPLTGTASYDGFFGAGGTQIFLGALMGSFAPQGPFGNFPPAVPPPDGTYFTIGYSKVVTLAAAGHIYAQINDTFYSNNLGGYTVEVARVVANAVPEPATWAMMLLGFFTLGSALRLRHRGPLPAA